MKNILLLFLTFVSVSVSSFADGWNQKMYEDIEKRIVAPTFSEKEFIITKYGAKVSASAKENQKAINKAIAICSNAGGGKVVVPEGTWTTGALYLKSNVNLVIKKGAVIHFAYNPSLYPLVKTRWEGLDLINYSPCIYSYQEKNIAISGGGVIDGGGTNDTWWQWCGATKYGFEKGKTPQAQNHIPYAGPEKYRKKKADGSWMSSREVLLWMADNGIPTEERIFGKDCGMRPQLVNFYECENILIENVTMLRSPFWVITPTFSKNITVRGCKIINDGPNGDGCDPESCENVLIENCIFHTGDDCIAIKSGRNGDGRKTPVPSRNIIVRGCTMEDGHGGVVIGSEISAGVENVFAENCTMDSPNLDRVLRIKTNTCRGGITDGIYMRNVKVGQCREAVLRINLVYEPKEPAERGHIPTVRNVYMNNVTCEKSRYGVLLNGLDSVSNIYNINIKDCTFNGVTDEAVRRTGLSHNLHFDNLQINGSLVTLDPPFNTYSEWMAMSEIKRVPQPYYLDFTDSIKKPEGKWSYVMGIELEGMLDAYLASLNPTILKYLKAYPEKMIDNTGKITGYKLEDYNLDNVRTGRFVLRMNRLFPEYSTKGTKSAVRTIFKQLEKQPRTKEGVWWHKEIYHWQVWLDGIYMGLPFYVMSSSELMGNKLALTYYDDAVSQITSTFERTFDEKSGLWKHAWDETHTMFWANPATGLSQHTWARAMGWFTMAMIEILDYLPDNYARRQEVIDMFKKTMSAVVKYQDSKTSVWYDVLDVNDSRNYLESTASSMFTYCLLKGARLGYLDDSYKKAGINAYEGILKQFIRVNHDRTISLTNCCSVSGLGPEKSPNRDGSFTYYISEPIRDNDAKGIGPFIWASLEMERDGFRTR